MTASDITIQTKGPYSAATLITPYGASRRARTRRERRRRNRNTADQPKATPTCTRTPITTVVVPPSKAQENAGHPLEEARHGGPIGHDVQDARKQAVDEGGQQAGAQEAGNEIAGHRRFLDGGFRFAGSAASLARNLAMRAISFTGTRWERGKRIVPLLTL